MGICHKESKIKNEIDVGGPVRVPLDSYMESSKAVCKLIIKELNKNATGFFLSDSSRNKFLLTNYHVISKEIVDSNMTIVIKIHNQKIFEIKLNKSKRPIQFFEKSSDITILQINDLEELCHNIKFFTIDLNYKKGYNIYWNNNIFILGYPFGKKIECSTGIIKEISKIEFKHNCNTDSGSFGSPIILVSNLSVIGIHKAGIIKENVNMGTFL